jgi:hypothetical protein
MKQHALLVTAAAFLAAACTHAPTRPTNRPQPETYHLLVRNNGWLDQDVYAYYLGHRYRLGMVSGYSSAVLKISRRDIQPSGQLQILVHPIGGGVDYLSPTVTLMEDQHPELSIDPGINSVSLSVMPNRDVEPYP